LQKKSCAKSGKDGKEKKVINNPSEAVEYLAQGVAEHDVNVFVGLIAAIAEGAGCPLKTLQMHFHEPMGEGTMRLQGGTWKFPRLKEK